MCALIIIPFGIHHFSQTRKSVSYAVKRYQAMAEALIWSPKPINNYDLYQYKISVVLIKPPYRQIISTIEPQFMVDDKVKTYWHMVRREGGLSHLSNPLPARPCVPWFFLSPNMILIKTRELSTPKEPHNRKIFWTKKIYGC